MTNLSRLLSAALLWTTILPATAQHLTLLHTNDTHSQIDPTAPPEDLGGVMRRKAVIDSIRRNSNAPVMLIDAGDAVQGSMFFTLFGGEVEQRLLNAMGYDLQIVGNHEFDNGMESLARNYSIATPTLLATNYDFDATPLAGMFKDYVIREVDGKKVAFIGLNINPAGLIDSKNWKGLHYNDPIAMANGMAWYLKKVMGADRVIAVTHIGYDDPNGVNDSILATRSRDIDVIIGGHSHTLIDPASPRSRVANAAGDSVLVVQTANKGRYLGEIDLDLSPGGKATYKLHRLARRTAEPVDSALESIIAPYRHRVDSVSAIPIGTAAIDFPQTSPRTLNLLSDFTKRRGDELAGTPVDLAIMNKGGIRNSISEGKVTKGDIMNMLPFDNRIVVMDLKGKDLLENLAIMASQGGNGVSKGVEASYTPDGRIISAAIEGKPIDPDKEYRVATITYLASGGDYMKPLTRGRIVATSDNVIFNDIIDAMESGFLKDTPLKADDTQRMHPAR